MGKQQASSAGRTIWANCDSEGDPLDAADPREYPVADSIDTVGNILLFYVGFVQTAEVAGEDIGTTNEAERWELWRFLGQHRIIQQETAARDFVPR